MLPHGGGLHRASELDDFEIILMGTLEIDSAVRFVARGDSRSFSLAASLA